MKNLATELEKMSMELEQTKKINELVNDSMVLLLIWERKFLKVKLQDGRKKPETLSYIQTLRDFIEKTNKIIEENYKLV